MLFYLHCDCMYSVPFECDFQKIAKINSQHEKPVSSNRKNLVPAKHKKMAIRKIKLPQKFSSTRYMREVWNFVQCSSGTRELWLI